MSKKRDITDPTPASQLDGVDEFALSALRNALTELPAPTPSTSFAPAILDRLTSGEDLTPMSVQIRRRIKWMLPTAIATMLVASVGLAVLPVRATNIADSWPFKGYIDRLTDAVNGTDTAQAVPIPYKPPKTPPTLVLLPMPSFKRHQELTKPTMEPQEWQHLPPIVIPKGATGMAGGALGSGPMTIQGRSPALGNGDQVSVPALGATMGATGGDALYEAGTIGPPAEYGNRDGGEGAKPKSVKPVQTPLPGAQAGGVK